jgi:hypothetical protein
MAIPAAQPPPMFPASLFSADATSLLTNFVGWSNLMAGIERAPSPAEVAAHRGLIAVEHLTVENMLMFVHHVQKGATLRRDVRPHGATSEDKAYLELQALLAEAGEESWPAERIHRCLRRMRPFTDANGRSARALWLRQALRDQHDAAVLPLPLCEHSAPRILM